MEIITFAATKGGVGKTTLAFNYGEYLASINKKILFIDLDLQCSLTQTYGFYENEGTVKEIFERTNLVQVKHVKPNIDIICGNMRLDSVQEHLATNPNKYMILFLWLASDENIEKFQLNSYDYIILDTHPDFGIATVNGLVSSNVTICPIIPGQYSYDSKASFEEQFKDKQSLIVSYESHKTYLNSKIYFLINMFEKKTSASKYILGKLKQENADLLCEIPRMEIFNKSTLASESLSSMLTDTAVHSRDKNKIKEILNIFDSIQKQI